MTRIYEYDKPDPHTTFGTFLSPPAARITGKERDAESGLDYFGAQYFSGAQGGFANVNGLVGDEIPMFQRDDPMLARLLDFGRSTALGTGPFGTFQLSRDPDCGEDPMLPVLLHTRQLQPHRPHRREAGFFYPARNGPTQPRSVPE